MKRRAPKGGCTVAGKFYKGGQFLPKPKPVDLTGEFAELLIQHAAESLPVDLGYSQVMRRVLIRGGNASVKDLAVLDRRRRAAVASLADHDRGPVRQFFGKMLAAYPSV